MSITNKQILDSKKILKKAGYIGVDSLFDFNDIIEYGANQFDPAITISISTAKKMAAELDKTYDSSSGITWSDIEQVISNWKK